MNSIYSHDDMNSEHKTCDTVAAKMQHWGGHAVRKEWGQDVGAMSSTPIRFATSKAIA